MAIDWKELRKDFENENVSVRALARKHQCDESSIRRKSKIDGWVKWAAKEVEGEITDATEISCEAKPVHVLDDHKALWKGVKKRLVKGLQNEDVKLGLEELKVAKMAGEVLSNVIKGERLAWGLEENNDKHDEAQDIAREMARITIPFGTEEALDGE